VQVFLQSAFLQALTRSLIASVWQMFLLWLVCIALFKWFNLTARQKFNIAFVSQFSGLALFIFTFAALYNTSTQTHWYALQQSLPRSFNSFVSACMPGLAIIYLAILIFKLSQFIFTYNESKTIKHSELKKIAADKRVFVEKMSAILSLHRKVKIYLSEKISCPLTIGFLKPVILIPVAAVNHLTTEQLEAVILHELAHIKRADYLLFIIQSVMDKIFFFNIFSLMLSNIIERERENACDDWVLQFRYNSMHYAEALFKLGRLKALPALAMPFAGKKESLLLTRVRRLLQKPQRKSSYNLLPAFGSGIFSLLVAASVFSISYVEPTEKKATQTIQTLVADHSRNIRPDANKSVQKEFSEAGLAFTRLPKKKEADTKKLTEDVRVAEKDKAKKIFDDQASSQYAALAQQQADLTQINIKLDSLKNIVPTINTAVNTQLIVTPKIIQKAISYQNFKRLENMLAVSGNDIKITESDSTKNSYSKHITIEATDKNGNKHVYSMIVEVYQ
jgi:beta-lactamase regulating signal transducer with metallopeptidase domain